jgi:cell division protein FtsW
VLTTLVKQLAFVMAAGISMLLMAKIFSFRTFRVLMPAILIGYIILMILPFFFPAVYGSHAWIYLGSLGTIQPSEFGKPLMILLCANVLIRSKGTSLENMSLFKLYRFPLLILLIDCALLVAQKDYGTLAITFMTVYICLLVPGWPGLAKGQKMLRWLGIIAVGLAVVFIFTDVGTSILSKIPSMAHIATRIENMKNPYLDVYGDGYQPANSLYGIASSNIIGRGYGNSARKFGYLTQADNDYILAVVIEETGIFGLLYIIVFYGLIWQRLFHYARQTSNMGYRTILIGTAGYLFLHFFMNVGGVGAFIPMTGVPLLFISSGGSSLVSAAIAIGLCQACISRLPRKDKHESSHQRQL